jgi:hypothetical protein
VAYSPSDDAVLPKVAAPGRLTPHRYDENQYSLPRWRDLSISRMGLYDDLYVHTPTQGWMFVPLGDYHAGGDIATFDGFERELEWAFAQYLGAGTAACYRGAQLWDNSTAVRRASPARRDPAGGVTP